ncbi:MAG: dihydroorotate dehydrogenase [Candidatus Omnitrophota bacterium]|jgi:dihydroorotate dehydrogenase (NAD+) catalytic subunit
MNPSLATKIGKLCLKNPVMVCSGTFGYGEEFQDFIDLKKLGALVTKTVTLFPRSGNPMPRTCETPAGLLNSIGLENPGLDVFLRDKLGFLKKTGVPIILSVASQGGIDEFIKIVDAVDAVKEIGAIELNISCPNVKPHVEKARHLISQDPQATYDLVRAVRKVTKKSLITKLSPNVTCIGDIALAAETAGSDAVSLINTLTGMSIDVNTRKSKIAAGVAGLSGPAIRPVAVKMVWETSRAVKIPVIGMGGIMDTASALEFFIAGASAVAIGTANFINPGVSIEIIDGIKQYLVENNMNDISLLRGSLQL